MVLRKTVSCSSKQQIGFVLLLQAQKILLAVRQLFATEASWNSSPPKTKNAQLLKVHNLQFRSTISFDEHFYFLQLTLH